MTGQPFVIAEAGVNHNGSVDRALAMVDVAADAGADAVKFQTFTATAMIAAHAPKAEYQVQATGSGQSQQEMIAALELSAGAHRLLKDRCAERGIEFLSTPFDHGSLLLLVDDLGVRTIKVPSGEVTNAPFLLEVGRRAERVILSTGMCTLDEVRAALKVLSFAFDESRTGAPDRATVASPIDAGDRARLDGRVTVLQCTTEYPAPVAEANLLAMAAMRDAFGLPVGYSDHTVGSVAAIAAVALGACLIEKHFTLDRGLPGPDHKASLEPRELAAMIASIRNIELALGDGIKRVTASERMNRGVARKSIVAARPIRKGETFSVDNLTTKRPGDGISPMRWDELLGKPAPRDFVTDERIEP